VSDHNSSSDDDEDQEYAKLKQALKEAEERKLAGMP
jgi:hypothetical protein